MYATASLSHDADSILIPLLLFLQSVSELGQVARAGVWVELGMDQPVPSCGHRIQRSRQDKHKRAVGYAGKAAALQGAGADAFE